SQGIPLGGVSGELVNLIADRVVKPPGHVSPDEFNRRHTVDFFRIGLPHWAVSLLARLFVAGFDDLGDLGLAKISDGETAIVNNHRFPCIRVDHTTQAWPGAGDSVRVAPEVTELGSFTPDDKQCRPGADRSPALTRTLVLLLQAHIAQRGL